MKKLFLILAIIAPFVSLAYEPTQTHAGLTEQVVEFYNLQSDNKITSPQKEFVIKGAMEEDEPEMRAVNHFYDPIHNIGINSGRTAKDWALNDVEENKYDWDDAIKLYAEGNENEAFVALGHVVHLIEDMGVPDHTRNDQHLPVWEALGGDSPYEDWAMQNKNRITLQGLGKQYADLGYFTKVFNNLAEHFDFLANYSNRNFFSRDSIDSSMYSEPTITSILGGYGYKKDSLTCEIAKLLIVKQEKDGSRIKLLSTKNDPSILSSYFDRLALQIIPSGAGVIELFFKEGEEARAVYQAEQLKKQQVEALANEALAKKLYRAGISGFFTRLTYGAGYLFVDNIVNPLIVPVADFAYSMVSTAVHGGTIALQGGVNGGRIALFTVGSAEVATYDYTKNQLALVPGLAKSGYEAGKAVATNSKIFIQQTINKQLQTAEKKPIQTTPVALLLNPQAVLTFLPKVQGGATDAPRLVFVGSFGGYGGSGGGGATAAPSPYVLGTQVSTSLADENATTNTNEQLASVGNAGAALAAPAISAPQYLQTLATDGCLLATTTIRFEWPVVPGADHYLLNKNGTSATTTEISLDVEIKDFSDYTLEIVAVGQNGATSTQSTQKVSVASIPIAINEIAWMGTVASANDEWFEIKNNTGHTIDLSQWELSAKNNSPRVVLKGEILPHSYIIFERTDDTAVNGIRAHATTTGAFDNIKGDQLTLLRNSIVFDQTPDGAWIAGYNSTTSRQTMERRSGRELGTDPTNWGTNLGYIKNGTDAKGNQIEGTPGAQNSVSTLINKGQDITSDFTLTSDEERYVLPGQIFVGASSTLTIEPGVVIQFYNSGGMGVSGAIVALGTEENPIIFNTFSNERAGNFYVDDSTGTSTFEHAHFENMNNVFSVSGGALEIKDSEFVNTDGGVDAYDTNSTVLIENTNFSSSTRDTIGVYNGAMVKIASSTIINQLDGDAIGIYDGSFLFMSSSTIDGVKDGNGIGAYDSFVSIATSTIRNTDGNAIWLSNSTTTIANTIVQGGELNIRNESSGIIIDEGTATIADTTVSGFTKGIGIAVTEPAEPVLITGGEVTGNGTGVAIYPKGSAIIADISTIHDNGKSPADDVVVW